jgi:predicted metal-binding protein
MKKYTIIVCKGCGRKFRIYPFEVYDGDPEYCRKCNDETKEKYQEIKYKTT